MTDDPTIAALLREREGYVRRNLLERVAQVDEQLAARGYVPDKSTGDAKESTKTPPKGRQAPPKRTA
jgi:hypothetical protein